MHDCLSCPALVSTNVGECTANNIACTFVENGYVHVYVYVYALVHCSVVFMGGIFVIVGEPKNVKTLYNRYSHTITKVHIRGSEVASG